jgi:hypothetical protein
MVNSNQKTIFHAKSLLRMEGSCLQRPYLTYGENPTVQPDDYGNVKYRGVLKKPFHFRDWVFVYSANSKYPKRDDDNADEAVNLMIKAGEGYGVVFDKPEFLAVHGRTVEDWKTLLKKDTDKNGTPEIIVFLLATGEESNYGELKRFVTN